MKTDVANRFIWYKGQIINVNDAKVNVFWKKNEQIVNKGEKITMDVRTYLEQQQVHPQLIRAVEEFRNQYPVEEKVKYRVSDPMMPFYGTEILEMGIAALLQKENLLLYSYKETEKNILAKNMEWIIKRNT